jgi:hypothetical protein
MTTKQRYAALAGLVLALTGGGAGADRAAALQASAQRPPADPVDMCGLLTQEEAAAILGTPVAAPQKGAGNTCTYAPQSGMGDDIMIHNLPLTFQSEEEFHAFLVEDTEKLNARLKKDLGDAVKPTTVDPVPEVGKPAYYVNPTLVILKDERVLSILAADREQAVAVAAKAVPRF